MHDPHAIENPTALISSNFAKEKDPYALFSLWFEEAQASEMNDPNAMTLATVDADGFPDARIVLLKDVSPQGFAFYTNTQSAKGRALAAHPVAALVFHWKSLRKQVRVRGSVQRVSDKEADAYFATRPRTSQIGAWASQQSCTLDSRETFEKAVADYETRFENTHVPRPPHWSGYRIAPRTLEFWHDQPFRLHDRIVFTRSEDGRDWHIKRLYP